MRIEEVRGLLTNLKIHIDQIESWTSQAIEMVYQIEETLFDIEDKEYSKKYELSNSIEFFKEATTRINHLNDCPARLSSRCSKDHIAADGFYQPDFKLNKIV